MALKINSLFEHRVPRDIRDAAEDDPAWLAGGVKIYGHEHSGGAHHKHINRRGVRDQPGFSPIKTEAPPLPGLRLVRHPAGVNRRLSDQKSAWSARVPAGRSAGSTAARLPLLLEHLPDFADARSVLGLLILGSE